MAAPNFYLREDGGPALDGVAAQLGISPSYLSRIFSEIDGKRFTQHLSGLRIEKAKRLPEKNSLQGAAICAARSAVCACKSP